MVEPQFEAGREFSEGLAAVRVGRQWGYLGESGKVVIEPAYPVVSDFSEGLAFVLLAGEANQNVRIGFIDRKGRMTIAAQYWMPRDPSSFGFSEGLCAMSGVGGYGYIDPKGAWVIEPQFGDALAFSEGLAAELTKDGSNGYIDTTGRLVIPAQYHDIRKDNLHQSAAFPFSEGLAAVEVGGTWGDGTWGFIDKTGKMVIEARFSNIVGGFSEGRAIVQVSGAWGFIDKTGALVIAARFAPFSRFRGGLAPVLVDGKQAYIDTAGTIVYQADEAP